MKWLVLLGFLLVSGCSSFVTKPAIEVREVRLSGIDRDGVGLDFMLAVTNPNSYSLRLTGYRYNLLVSALPLASGENHEVIDFKGNAVTDVRLPVRISFRDLLKILRHRTDPEHIPYQLTAGFDLDTPVGAISIPVKKSGTLAVPEKYRPDQFLKLFQ